MTKTPIPTQDRRVRYVFEDRFEEWEQNAIDGTGQGPRIALSVVKRDKGLRFRSDFDYKKSIKVCVSLTSIPMEITSIMKVMVTR